MSPRAAHTLALDTLPDELLSRVLALAGREAGPSASLVSKRWNRLVFSEPALWRQLSFHNSLPAYDLAQQDRWFACKLRLLQRVAPLVRRFAVHDEAGSFMFRWEAPPGAWTANQVLQLLHPGTLRQLSLTSSWRDQKPDLDEFLRCGAVPPQQLTPLAAPAIGRFTALECLTLDGEAFHPAHTLEAVAALPRLRSLTLSQAYQLPRCVPDIVRQLPQSLQALQLEGPHMPAGTMAAVLTLTQLRSLQLACYQAALEPPERLTALHQLTQLCLTSGGRDALAMPQPRGFPAGLAAFHMERSVAREAAPIQVAGALLRSVEAYAIEFHGGTVLHIEGLAALPSMHGLLAALLPAGLPGFAALELRSCTLPLAALRAGHTAAGSGLSTVRKLWISDSSVQGGSWSAALPALVGAAAVLEELTLEGCLRGEPFPTCLLVLTSLTSLHLSNNGLAELPDGPMLAGLAELECSQEELARLPPALTSATALTSLKLPFNEQLQLAAGDLALLQRMPSLAELQLPAATIPNMPAALRSWLGQRLKVAHHRMWWDSSDTDA